MYFLYFAMGRKQSAQEFTTFLKSLLFAILVYVMHHSFGLSHNASNDSVNDICAEGRTA